MAARTAYLFLVLAISVLGVQGAAPARSLLQSGVTCAADIPACTPRRCTTRILGSREQYVCLRCMASFQPVRGSDGRSIVQCICPPGTKMVVDETGARTCAPCTVGFYCPGGNGKVTPSANPTAYGGEEFPCNPGTNIGLTTKAGRSSRRTDCVALGGYSLPASPGEPARQCPANTYAPAGNRLRDCMPCPSGFRTPSGSYNRDNRNEACQVPPGHFLELNVIRACPVGLYRQGFVKVDDKDAISCLSCPPGYTTSGIGSESEAACTKVLPGFGLWPNIPGNTPEDVLLEETNNATQGGLFYARCDYGYYSDGTTANCIRCPYGSTTRTQGSLSLSDCMVPPGYYVKEIDAATNNYTMAKCPRNVDNVGYYRDGWVSPKQVIDKDGTKACKGCGKNILSAYVDRDEIEDVFTLLQTEEPRGFVAATSAACYILFGWGITFDPQDFSKFKAELCPVNMYGVDKERAYGLINAPCKACAKNLLSPSGSYRFDNCTNPAGFGYTSEGANQCPPNFYTAAQSMSPCEPCPPGRITDYEPGNGTLQDSILDCKVPTGHGVFSADAEKPWEPETPSADMVVKKCPLGYYAVSDSGVGEPTSNPRCQKCPDHQSTSDEGLTACDVCAPGYGIPDDVQSTDPAGCVRCPLGTYHAGGGLRCTKCPTTTFNHIHVGDTYVSKGITFDDGLTGPETCVPKYAQLPQPAGARFALDLSVFTNTSGVEMKTCIEECPERQCCLVQWEEEGKLCRRAVLPILPDPPQGVGQLYYKLPPSELISAASVKNGSDAVVRAKTQPAGIYTRCEMTDEWVKLAAEGLIGTSTNPERAEMTDAAAAVEWDDCTDEKSCRAKCESDAACWGFIYHPDNGWTTRGGEDQLGVRSFMSSPNIAAPAPPEEEGESSIPRVCPAGSGGFTECAPCTGNMYNDGTQLLCQPCASNQMAAADDGSSLLVKCVPRPPEKCEAGQGFPRGCSTDCKCEKCPINTFSTGVDTTCQACATGWEAKVEGSSSCVQQPPPPCNPGYGNWPQCDDTCVGRNKYNDGSFKQCQSCGAGERPNRDGTGCVAVIKECLKGEGLVGAPDAYDSRCAACTGNEFNPGGLQRCVECKPGDQDVDADLKQVSKAVNSAKDKCVFDRSCPAGRGNPDKDCSEKCLEFGLFNDGKSFNCQSCPTGTTTTDGIRCRRPRVCKAGFGGNSCNQKCDPDEYQDGTGLFCKECPPGQRPNSAQSGCEADDDNSKDRSCARRKPKVSMQCPGNFMEEYGSLPSLYPRCVATSKDTTTCPAPLVKQGTLVNGMLACQCPYAQGGEVPKLLGDGELRCVFEAVFLPDAGSDTDSPKIGSTTTGIWYDLIPSTKKCRGAQQCWDMCFFCDGRPRYHRDFKATTETKSQTRPTIAKIEKDSCDGSGKNCNYERERGQVQYESMAEDTQYAAFCNKWGVDAMHFSEEAELRQIAVYYNAVMDPVSNAKSGDFFDDDGAVIWPLRPKKNNNDNAVVLYGIKSNWPATRGSNNGFFQEAADEIEYSLLRFGM